MMNHIRNAGGHAWPHADWHALAARRQQPTAGATATAASAERDVTASLNITTKEGDTVTINASLETSLTYAGVRGGGKRADVWNASTSSEFSFQVQGDLNEQERAEIARVVKTFMHDLRALAKGRDVSVANVAEGDAQTLASISASADSKTTLTIGAAVVGSQRPQPWDSPARPVDVTDGSLPRDRVAIQPIAVPVTGTVATPTP